MKEIIISSDINDVPDSQLVAAARSGQEDAFGQLLQRHQAPLLNMVFRRLGHRQEAEDVVQQVFIKAYQHISSFRGESKFYTWLYTIALNLIRNHIRQRQNRRTISMDDKGFNDEGPARQWAETGPSPEEQVSRRKEIEAIQDSLSSLDEEQKTIFVWHYFQQLPLDEVARRLGRPLGTVKVYLHRARKVIHKAMHRNEMRMKLGLVAAEYPGPGKGNPAN